MNPNTLLRYFAAWLCSVALASSAVAQQGEPFPFEDGDKIALVGGTFIERDVRYGYLEATLTARLKDTNLRFRNFAWSGDTVWGEARASFDTAKEGYERLLKHVRAWEPTVVVLAYGGNEAFAGPEGLNAFSAQYNKLLQDLAELNARFILIGPHHHEAETSPRDEVASINQNIDQYNAAIQSMAEEQGHFFINFEEALNAMHSTSYSFTDNGMHFMDYGYWLAGRALCNALGYPVITLQKVETADQPFALDPTVFFSPAPPDGTPLPCHMLFFEAPEDQVYQLWQDNNAIHKADAEAWRGGIRLEGVQETARVDSLRAAIVEKNQLFFNQWRPQNETYIFGFRKHEQGQYAEEVPLYDPLIEEMEAQIRHLCTFDAQTYHFEAITTAPTP